MSVFSVRSLSAGKLARFAAVQQSSPCGFHTGESRESTSPEFLPKSVIPTDHFQKSLPRLPIPKLEDTCRRYLAALTPLLSDADFKRTQSVVKAFQEKDGKDWWFDMYLKDRRPVVLTHNPYVVFTDDSRKEYNDQLVRATNVIVSSMRFMKTHRANALEPELYHMDKSKSDNMRFRRFVSALPKSVSWYGAYWYKAFPLDMSQYGRLFNSTRIPRQEKDELFTDETARHILIIRNGHHYVFDVLNKDGGIRPASEIMAELQKILSDSSSPPSHPLGVLTTENRDVWARVRQQLIDAGNTDELRLVDSAVFAISLEDTMTEEPNQLSRLFLFGDPANKWFDKSFTVIMTRTGKAAVNFEHSWGDGVAVLRYFNEVYADSTTRPAVNTTSRPATIDSGTPVKKLEWRLTDAIRQAVDEANAKYRASTSKLDVNYLRYDKFGQKFIKSNRLSPDSFSQLAIQMAFYKQYGQTVATYESCSTAAFKHGRTETIRPGTMATKTACQLFAAGKSTVGELRQSLEKCSAMHGQLTKEAAMGQGFDRHLLGLKQIAQITNIPLPPLYTDPAYAYINHNILSTSTLSSPAVQIGGFAPVVPDGYGVGYGVEDAFLGCNVTCYPPSRNVTDFLECMRQSFDDMHAVLEGRLPSKS